MKKKHLLTVLFSALFALANAQSNFGVDQFGFGEYQTAKKYFEEQVSQSPAQSNYYLGEIAYLDGKVDEAKAFYEKGIAAAPDYMLNYVGQGKLMLKTDPKAAELAFATALKKNKKDPAVNVAIAKAYFDAGMKEAGVARLALAKKYAKKSPLIYTLEGDLLRAEANAAADNEVNRLLGEAGSKYEQAVYFDPNYTVAAFKHAQVYERISPNVSIEKFTAMLAVHPDYVVINRELGKSYHHLGQYQKAIESFTTYAATNSLNLEDMTQLALDYFFTDQYAKSIELVNAGLKVDSSNFVLNRIRMYNAAKTNDVANGQAAAEYFFTLKSENSGSFLPKDYTAYATILSNAGQFPKALEIYAKILEANPNQPDLYKELNTVYTKMGNRVKAVEALQKFVDMTGPDALTAVDYYQLGRAYYSAGTSLLADSTITDKTQAKDLLVKADTVFGTVCNLTPDSYTGYIWRGHTNAKLDPDFNGLAKPYYEAAANIILNKAKESGLNGNKKDLISCYDYLGYFYFNKEDKENATKYYSLILELDPANKNANAVLDEYKNAAAKQKK